MAYQYRCGQPPKLEGRPVPRPGETSPFRVHRGAGWRNWQSRPAR